MSHVMPTLTKGLIECCKQKPEDPIDYLAEYLFKNNPQVDWTEWRHANYQLPEIYINNSFISFLFLLNLIH